MKKIILIVSTIIIGLYTIYQHNKPFHNYMHNKKQTTSKNDNNNNDISHDFYPKYGYNINTQISPHEISPLLVPFKNQTTNLTILFNESIGQTKNESQIQSNSSLMGISNYYESSSEIIKVLLISDYTNNRIVKCIVDKNNMFKCDTFINNIQAPQEISLISNNLFIIGMDNQMLYKCNLNNNLNNKIKCSSTSINIAYPTYMYYNLQYLYISDFSAKHIIRCSLDSEYNVTSCIPNESINKAYFNSTNYQNKFYIPNYTLNSIDQCDNLNKPRCNHLTNELIIHPLTNAVFDDRFYLINTLSETSYNIIECKLSEQNQFIDCRIVIDDIAMPISIVGIKVNNQTNPKTTNE